MRVDASRGPRLHDFRHRFAVQTLLRWYRNGEDPKRRLPILSTYLGHAHVTDTYWYLTGTPELLRAAGDRLEKRWEGLNAGSANLPALLQSFFTTRLMAQRKASPHTIASYRDTFRLLLQFAQRRLRKAPSQLELNDLDGALIGAFLEDLEKRRRNGPRSRNLRLTAIRSFFRYASLEAPAQSGVIQRVLAIPNQRQPRALVGFLTRPEIEALLAAPDRTTWLGRRDHAFLLTAVQTGLRLSEMTSLRHEDVSLGAGAHVHCRGKGRKERCTPLAKPTVAVLRAWIREQGRGDSKTLFPSARGGPLSADGVQHLLARHVAQARKPALPCERNAYPRMS